MKNTKKTIITIITTLLLVASVSFLMTGCIDADYSVLEAKLESVEYGYAANSVEAYGITGCSQKIKADKGTIGTQGYQFVFILYFETEDAAIDYYKTILEGYAWEALTGEKFYAGLADTMSYERVFNIVICGTKQAVKDVLA